ncbi:alpha/beta hydrolase fold domain-containing protein [Nocardiopsis sp. HNM0947]|uniref:Alpha/beta hydrolase fold domain-containing protein n=1 Tax=Nocardiopsis coralli TaxID=2772213 RepID=A0ABR9P9L6_9ACTN|nr:alpha/beta hydrolase fold domain-containing protein [Nocardiopsis coralli]MBE3000536.1 alpha/beta hydrolase fold domain-containing protein [Nocardiopsis coralli]
MLSAFPRPPFDAELEAVLAALADQIPPTLTADMIPQLRQAAPAQTSDEVLAEAGLTRRDVTVPGHLGDDITVSVIKRRDHRGPGPGIFHTHGGGMVSGDRFSALTQVIPWVVEHDAVMVTVEYRLAPEFPDPYPVEDCYAGLLWTAEHAAELGIDPERLLIAGASAGGGLAAGVTLMARDRRGPALAGQMLMYPMLDDRDRTVSSAQMEGVGLWDRASNTMGWTALLGERRRTDEVSVYAAPARATDLSGLPPAFIDCGSAEVFRDEDVAYASALWRDGVQAELHVWPGGFHGFDLAAPHTALAHAMTEARNSWVARLLGA